MTFLEAALRILENYVLWAAAYYAFVAYPLIKVYQWATDER